MKVVVSQNPHVAPLAGTCCFSGQQWCAIGRGLDTTQLTGRHQFRTLARSAEKHGSCSFHNSAFRSEYTIGTRIALDFPCRCGLHAALFDRLQGANQ
jgi:hypothetical protein